MGQFPVSFTVSFTMLLYGKMLKFMFSRAAFGFIWSHFYVYPTNVSTVFALLLAPHLLLREISVSSAATCLTLFTSMLLTLSAVSIQSSFRAASLKTVACCGWK